MGSCCVAQYNSGGEQVDSLLKIVEQRVGISRFMGLLQKPLSPAFSNNSYFANSSGAGSAVDHSASTAHPPSISFWFFCRGYHEYYCSSVESAKSMILETYAGSIPMSGPGGFGTNSSSGSLEQSLVVSQLQEKVRTLTAECASVTSNYQELERLRSEDSMKMQVQLIEQLEQFEVQMQEQMQKGGAVSSSDADVKSELDARGLKISQLEEETKDLKAQLQEKKRKIAILEEELTGPVPYERVREKHITDLEGENTSLAEQMQTLAGDMQGALGNYRKLVEAVSLMGGYCNVTVPEETVRKCEMDGSAAGVVAIGSCISITAHTLTDAVHECLDQMTALTGKASDIATAQNLFGRVSGGEDSFDRLESCVNLMASVMEEQSERLSGVAAAADRSPEQLSAQLVELQSVFDEKATHCNNLQSDLDSYVNYSKELEEQVAKYEGALAEQREELQQCKQTLELLDSERVAGMDSDEQKGQLSAVAAELEQTKSDLASAVDANSEYATYVEALDGDLQTARAELDQLKTELVAVTDSKSAVEAELEQAKADLEGTAQANTEFTSHFATTTEELQRVKEELEQARTQTSLASAVADSDTDTHLSAVAAELEQTKSDLASAVDANSEYATYVEALDGDLQTARAELAAAGEANKSYADYVKSLTETHERENTALVEEHTSICAAKDAQSAEVQKELERLRELLTTKENQLAASRAELEEAKQQVAQAQEDAAEERGGRFAEMVATISRLEEDCNENNEIINQFQLEKADLEKTIEMKEHQFSVLEAQASASAAAAATAATDTESPTDGESVEIAALRGQVVALEAELVTARDELKSALDANGEYSVYVEELGKQNEAQVGELQARIQQLEGEKSQTSSTGEEMAKQVAALEAQVATSALDHSVELQTLRNNYKTEFQAIIAKQASYDTKVKDMEIAHQQELEAARGLQEEQTESMGAMQKTLRTLQNESERSHRALKKVGSMCQPAVAQLAASSDACLAEATEKMDEISARFDSIQSQTVGALERLISLQATNRKLQTEYQQLQSKTSSVNGSAAHGQAYAHGTPSAVKETEQLKTEHRKYVILTAAVNSPTY